MSHGAATTDREGCSEGLFDIVIGGMQGEGVRGTSKGYDRGRLRESDAHLKKD